MSVYSVPVLRQASPDQAMPLTQVPSSLLLCACRSPAAARKTATRRRLPTHLLRAQAVLRRTTRSAWHTGEPSRAPKDSLDASSDTVLNCLGCSRNDPERSSSPVAPGRWSCTGKSSRALVLLVARRRRPRARY
eukprot:6691854-Prymnesium_polylepis.1